MQKLQQIPQNLRKMGSQVWFFVGIPIWFILFVLLYEPSGITPWLEMAPRDLLHTNLSIVASILLVTLTGTRIAFHFMQRNLFNATWTNYILWCLGEFFLCAALSSIYMSLMGDGQYLPELIHCIRYLFSIIIYPYVIISLMLAMKRDEDPAAQGDEGRLIKFYDSSRKLKLSIVSDAVLYIAAEENYVRIYYLENENVRNYLLRASMKSLESVVQGKGLKRCQRSFFINPAHIKALRKEPSGIILAELDVNGVSAIPVSHTYFEEISASL
ncbi:MAG: LytTR family transcriptional regulator [Bacteroidales bacterium]|nr:LytTR family transcriptional regulator [Bacteroidales bacterium]